MKKGIKFVIVILTCVILASCSSSNVFKKTDEVYINKNNWEDYIVFEKTEDNSTEGLISAVIVMREKGNYIFCDDVEITVNVEVWYHCGDNDLDKETFKCDFTNVKNSREIKLERDDIIDFNGETIKSVKYDVESTKGHIKPYTDSQS